MEGTLSLTGPDELLFSLPVAKQEAAERKIARAQAALAQAEARHNNAVSSLAKRQSKLDDESRAENDRWESEKRRYEAAIDQRDG